MSNTINTNEQLLIGNIKATEVFVCFQIGFIALVDFNFWVVFNAYNVDDGYTEKTQKDFSDYLIDHSLAKCFPQDVETHPGLAEELKAAEALWVSYPLDKQRTLCFGDFTNLVSVQDLRDLAIIAPGAGTLLNHDQIYCIAANLEFMIQGVTIREYLLAATDATKQDPEFLINCVRAINFAAAKAEDEALAAAQGYAVTTVFATEEGGYDRAYSKGAAAKVGYEVISLVHGISARTLGVFVDNFITMATEDDAFDFTAITERCGTLSNGQALRIRAIEADPKALSTSGFLPGIEITDTLRVIQVLVPDANNVLPDEEGYQHEIYPQLMFPLTAGDATVN
jgi:hypothetical protein